MADQPVPPDSIILRQFAGIKNTVASERLAPTELEKALNVDIDDAGEIRRRRGSTLVAAGSYHSLFSCALKTLVVKNGSLCLLYPNYTTTTLLTGVGSEPLAYVQVGDRVYFSSSSVSGIVEADNTVSGWGAVVDETTWLSPVVNPTSNIGAIRGKLLGKPPMATALAYYNGRIYMAQERVLWATELFLYDYVDKTRTFFYFEDDITAIGVVSDGLYVGTTTHTYFLQGDNLANLSRNPVQHYGILPGSMVDVPAELVPAQTPSKNAVLFMTEYGLCAGMDSGVCYNLTQDKVLFPQADRIAPLFRRQDGINQYIGVAATAGTPTSSARIGDYVDAEIRRFNP